MISALILLLTVLGTLFAWIHFSSKTRRAQKSDEPVSILKPLSGLDPELEINLDSFFRIEYPKFELLFAVADPGDPSIPLVQRKMIEYPDVSARIFIGAEACLGNPKIRNLIRAYESVQYDLLWISDSNTRTEPEALLSLVSDFDSDTGVMTSVVIGCRATNWISNVERTFFDSFYARWMILASFFGFSCVIGKSMMIRKSVIERFGGFKALERYIAEDHMAGVATQKLGLKVRISKTPCIQILGSQSMNCFWQRHLRWARLRRVYVPFIYFFECFSGVVGGASMGAVAVFYFGEVSISYFLIAYSSIWFVSDFLLGFKLSRKSEAWLLSWILREALALPLFVHSMTSRRVVWRNSHICLGRGGLID